MIELVPIRYAGGDGIALTGSLAEDPIVTPVQCDAFLAEPKAAGVDWQLHLYGGAGHSFTNRDIGALNLPGFAYDEAADRRSWAAMLNLFEEVLERP